MVLDMSKAFKIARRTFLAGSMAISGGIAFGYYTVKKPHANPLLDDIEPDEASFNPWIKISPDKITLITPHPDIGQGAVSMQAALMAEEMDLEFGQFETSFGATSPAYYNTAMGPELFPALATDTSFVQTKLGDFGNSVFKLMGQQITGGSSSTSDSFHKLRLAGAIARETLKKAASKTTRIPVSQLKTQSGNVILPDGTQLKYIELATSAASIKPVTNVQLRPASQWRLIGKPMKRLDIVAKSTGQQNYGIDLKKDAMVHATVKTNPRKGGLLLSFDAQKAKIMRGVIDIFEIKGGVAIIADNTWRAFQAADAVQCEWGPAPYPSNQAEHWKELEASFTPERLDKVWRDDGNTQASISNSETVFQAEYKAPYAAHAPLEPLGALIEVSDDRADIWVSHQIPAAVEKMVASITGHKPENVYIHNQYCGGSFGHRLEFDNILQAAEIANKMRGTPVKLTYSREEDMLHDYTRQIAMARGKGVVSNGKIETLDLSCASVSAVRSQSKRMGMPIPGPDAQIASGMWNLTYDIPNYRMRGYAVPDGVLAPTSSWRSVGAATGGFFADCFIDELIHEAGLDPLEARIIMTKHDVSRKVLEAVADMSNWGSPMAPNQGRGVAFVESFGVPVAQIVEVTNTTDGIKIDKVFVAADVGKIIDPINFDNHVKGGVVWGLGHAMNAEITYWDGMAEQTNYHMHAGMRMHQCPEIIVRGLENGPIVKGIGEPTVPVAPPALANAIFAATGKRIREMPFNKHIDFI